MLRSEGYVLLEGLGEKAVRMARIANSMLVSGQRSADREQKHLRADSERVFLTLVEGLFGANCAVGERGAMVRLGGALRRVTDAAAETAMLLRGRTVRMWALFDRVRMSVAQTERLAYLLQRGQKGANESEDLRDFCERSIRLSELEEQSFEKMLEEREHEVAIFLSSSLGEWRVALSEAFDAAVALRLEFGA